MRKGDLAGDPHADPRYGQHIRLVDRAADCLKHRSSWQELVIIKPGLYQKKPNRARICRVLVQDDGVPRKGVVQPDRARSDGLRHSEKEGVH